MRVQSYRRLTSSALAAALAALALAAPAAPARPVEQFLGTQSSHNSAAAPTAHVSPASSARDLTTDAGFSWGAAAIGAGTALGLLALASMAAIARSGRGRIRTAR